MQIYAAFSIVKNKIPLLLILKALVCLNDPNGVNHYINHYGDCIGYPESESSYEEHMLGTGYYPYGDLPDVLDAFEGDESNFWNID